MFFRAQTCSIGKRNVDEGERQVAKSHRVSESYPVKKKSHDSEKGRETFRRQEPRLYISLFFPQSSPHPEVPIQLLSSVNSVKGVAGRKFLMKREASSNSGSQSHRVPNTVPLPSLL
ncbi:hypothetical protein TNCV_841361 [Trichonephila clavipes]|nr:hypothetical protein TNCV_841361 [Trichonephila clavipes]